MRVLVNVTCTQMSSSQLVLALIRWSIVFGTDTRRFIVHRNHAARRATPPAHMNHFTDGACLRRGRMDTRNKRLQKRTRVEQHGYECPSVAGRLSCKRTGQSCQHGTELVIIWSLTCNPLEDCSKTCTLPVHNHQ